MILHDIHIHTHISSCGSPEAFAEGYISRAKEIGLKTVGFSDHMWDRAVPGASRWYEPQDFAHVCGLIPEVPKSHRGVHLLFGCEAECRMDGVVGLSEEVAQKFDYILIAHGHDHMKNFVMPAEFLDDHPAHAKFAVRHFKDILQSPLRKYFTSVAHPFVPGTRHGDTNAVLCHIPDRDFRECFEAARDAGIALEMNGSTFIGFSEEEIRNLEYVRMYAIAKECGCRFTYGSDSHCYGDRQLGKVELLKSLAGISDSDFLDMSRIESKTFFND